MGTKNTEHLEITLMRLEGILSEISRDPDCLWLEWGKCWSCAAQIVCTNSTFVLQIGRRYPPSR